jgi:hypothetical protein
MDSRRILMVLGVAIGLNCTDAEARQSGPSQLRIVIHNQADLPAGQLESVRDRVAGSLREAGVQVVWHQGPPPLQPPASFVVNVLLRKHDPNWVPNRRPIMGMALASDQYSGTTMIYYQAIAGVARKYNHSVIDLLAIAITHEIGHLLLPHPAHAAEGIMRADWEGDDIRHAVNEPLQFTAAQAELVRLKLSGASEKPRE